MFIRIITIILLLQVSLSAITQKIDYSKVILGVSSPTLSPQLKRYLQSGLGGVILIGKSWKYTNDTQHFIKAIKTLSPTLLVCIDQEGGSVTRLKSPHAPLPSAQTIGRLHSVYTAHQLGMQNGLHLKSLGIDINFAPVLDVITATHNTVIGSRSFGTDPDHVAQLGIAYMKGLKDSGILPVIKHFPGHGDTIKDSHYELPINHHSMRYLENISIKPFYHAIQYNAPAVMLAHILYPTKDPIYPASLSQSWIQYLRNDLGFTGLIITDDLSMKAISNHYSTRQAIDIALTAGVDYVIISNLRKLNVN